VDVAVAVALGIAGLALVVAFTERIVARRRTYAALVASGVPRGVIARAALWQTLLPAVPAIGLSLGVGMVLARAFGSTQRAGGNLQIACIAADRNECLSPDSDPSALLPVHVPEFVRSVPLPWAHLALLGGGALLLVVAVVGLSLTMLRTSTDIAELRTG
jgi:hypothetical protein